MLLEHRGKTPHIHPSAYIAPTATICGDVSIGENSRVLFGAILAQFLALNELQMDRQLCPK
ncbi:MAG: hypothetical protein E6J36_07050 [Chloroflexi bacterium]|nr:MAG: hypothetical protein E6J36_07050 [Chloroflexota bacterium]